MNELVPTDPPAIIQEAVDLDLLAAQINQNLAIAESKSIEGAELFRQVGLDLIKAKAIVGHGHWGKWVDKNVSSSTRRAQRCMQLANASLTTDLETTWSILNGNDAKPKESPYPPEKRCRECRVNGRSKPHCKACDKANKKNAQGSILFDCRNYHKAFGGVVRIIDELGNAYKCKESPAAHKLRTILEQFHQDFKAWYKKVAKQELTEIAKKKESA